MTSASFLTLVPPPSIGPTLAPQPKPDVSRPTSKDEDPSLPIQLHFGGSSSNNLHSTLYSTKRHTSPKILGIAHNLIVRLAAEILIINKRKSFYGIFCYIYFYTRGNSPLFYPTLIILTPCNYLASSSDPSTLDNASATTFSFPAICLISRLYACSSRDHLVSRILVLWNWLRYRRGW